MKKRIVMMMLACAVCAGNAFGYFYPNFRDVESDGINYRIVNDEYLAVSSRDTLVFVYDRESMSPPLGNLGMKPGHKFYSGDVVIPDSLYVEQLGHCLPVKMIDVGAFAFCPDLTSVTVLGELDDIDDGAFCFSPKLERLDLRYSDAIWRIPLGICSGCESLTQFEMPATIRTIESSAFYGSGIEHLVLPAGVASIWRLDYVFGGVSNLKSVTCMVPDPSSIKAVSDVDWWEYEMAEGCVLYVPEESVELYRADVRWQCFSEIRAIGDVAELPEVGSAAECDDEILYDLLGRPISAPQPGQVVIRRGAKAVY